MASAVENARVVVVCVSESYKNSPSCRTGQLLLTDTQLCACTEAEYAYRLHKDIVPLIMQPKYKADGWLGALLGNKLYFDVSDADKLTSNMPLLMVELERRIGGGAPSPTRPTANHLVDTNTTTLVASASSHSFRSSYETCATTLPATVHTRSATHRRTIKEAAMSPLPTRVAGVEEPDWSGLSDCA
ncbi:unnamed protein product [Sphagnum balticum]